MSKRARHTGTVQQRGANSWRIRYYVPGQEKQVAETVKGSHKDAERTLRERLVAAENGGYVPQKNETVSGFMQRWLDTYVATNTTPRTQVGYKHYVRRHINPSLGGAQLQNLPASQIQRLYSAMLESGLSPTTVLQCHRILKEALSHAVKWGEIVRNPAEAVTPPRKNKTELSTWDAATFHLFLDAASDSQFRDFYHLAALTGMRRSEICGLKWDDVQLEASAIQVRRTLQRIDGKGLIEGQPKTKKSRRTISIGASAVNLLRMVRLKQAESRLKLGELWQGTGHVFTGLDGGPISGERVSREFARIVRQASLPYLTLHGLRHTAASLMIAGGVHAKAIADILGHSSITVTMDTYGHLINGVQQEAIDILDNQLSAGM